MVDGRAELIYGVVWGDDMAAIKGRVRTALELGFTGVCAYESDFTVCEPEWRRFHRWIGRQSLPHEARL